MLWKKDDRGRLLEAFQLHRDGLVFVVEINPGETRGKHYHKRKIEKFLVIKGKAVLTFMDTVSGLKTSHHLNGEEPEVITVYPYTYHYITAVGDEPCTVLVWCNEQYDPKYSDTYSINGVLQ